MWLLSPLCFCLFSRKVMSLRISILYHQEFGFHKDASKCFFLSHHCVLAFSGQSRCRACPRDQLHWALPSITILPVAHVPVGKKKIKKSGFCCCLLWDVRKGLIFCPEGFSGFSDWLVTFETGASWGKCKQWSVSPCFASQPGDMLFNCVAGVSSGLILLGSISACRGYCPCHKDQSE